MPYQTVPPGAKPGGASTSNPVGSGRGVVQGYRVDPFNVQQADMPMLQAMPVRRAEQKLGEIQRGAELALMHPFFPETRRYRDVLWIAPFIGILIAMFTASIFFAGSIGAPRIDNLAVSSATSLLANETASLDAVGSAGIRNNVTDTLTTALDVDVGENSTLENGTEVSDQNASADDSDNSGVAPSSAAVNETSMPASIDLTSSNSSTGNSTGINQVTNLPGLGAVMMAGTVGALVSLGAAAGYIVLARTRPACVVWTSLLFSPCLLVVVGIVVTLFGVFALGILMILIGALSITCIFYCYRPLIPFTISLVAVISGVMIKHPGLIAVSALGSFAGLIWSMLCGLTFIGAFLLFENQLEGAKQGQLYAIYFFSVLIFVWGGQVVYNVCHVTYCGLFGRWYCGRNEANALRTSLKVALTTSFGSICFGSFMIAAIRALEAVVRQARVQAQEEQNILSCILLLVLECAVQCIGDILEYFSEWAYVQCAVRGVSFFEAARITYSMITCANLGYVIQDLLINSVVNLGALLCAAVGCGAGAITGFALSQSTGAVAGAVIGFFAGLMSGGSAAGVLTSGSKTLLVMWAENPEPFRRAYPGIHAEFEQRILAKIVS
jgi:hypothetical protein